MMKRARVHSPQLMARVAGLLYALIFVFGVSGAAAATPTRMTLTSACDIGVALILFALLQAVNRNLAIIAAAFRLISVAVTAATSLIYFGVLGWFNAAHSAAAFDTGYTIALVPFGVQCLLFGYLIFKSGCFPRLLGMLYALAGLAYMVCLWPALGQRLFFPYIVVPAVLGEGSLTLWLLFVGINVPRWEQLARRNAQPVSR